LSYAGVHYRTNTSAAIILSRRGETEVVSLIGQTISHYKIVEKLGGGGMGVVYKAQDLNLGRFVALKFLPPDLIRDPEAKARFIHEARSASALDHSNICNIHEIDETDDGQIFIAMAFYDGETVKKKVERAPLKLDEALDIAIQVAQGLVKAHGEGIVHRDIKPANVMVTKDGVAKIVDFGLAKLTGMTRLTRTGTTVGTVGYMSPEQTRGDMVDHRSDVWSLGAMLYEMVTGQSPFKGDYENAVVYSIVNTQPEPMTGLRTGVPVELERIVAKALAKDPSERYQHVDEMLVDLKHLRKEGETATAPHPATAAGAPQRRPRWKRLRFPTALAILFIAAFFLLRPILFEADLISEPKPVAVVTFVNQTGDKTYDYLAEAIPNLLITNLEQSRYLRVMTWERMHDLLTQMGKKDVAVIDKDLGFELCRREGIHAIVTGSFVKAGDTFVTDVKVLDVDTKELLKAAVARGEGVQSILDRQINDLSKEIARGVGLTRRKIDSSPLQIAEVTTSSMDAYNYFLRGREDCDKLYFNEARQFLEKAVALDSAFALAYLYLAEAYDGLIDFDGEKKAIERANALSWRAPEKERLFIEARHAYVIERNPAKRQSLIEELTRKYPQEKRFHDDLGVIYRLQGLNREAEQEFEKALQLDPNYGAVVNELAYTYADEELYEKAIETLQRYASLSPGDANPFDSMGELYLMIGRLDESVARYTEAVHVKPDFTGAYMSLAYVFALKEEYSECLRCLDDLLKSGPPIGVKALLSVWKARYYSMVGRYRESSRETGLSSDLMQEMGGKSFMPPVYWAKTLVAMERRDLAAARQEAIAFCQSFEEYHPEAPAAVATLRNIMLGFIELESGRYDSARARVAQAKSTMTLIEMLQETLPMNLGLLEGELLLAEGLPDSAINVCRRTAVPGPRMGINWRMAMYSFPLNRDIVPRAFQKKGELDSAIVEYNRLLRIDPTTKDRRLIEPKFHYRLAKLYDQTGSLDRAQAEYKRFLEIWKKADTDLPEFIDACKRLASLRGGS
jgi:tetratricopeptide (TPR) repeat protein